MDNKPWQDKGPRRSFDGEDGDRRGRSDRFDRFDRFDRSDRSDRRDFGDRRPFGDRRSFGDRKPGGHRFGEGRREDFGVRTGPRARAYDTRRFAERSDFARNAMVKIDSDIADFFGSPEAVNQALRLLIDAARVVKLDAVKPAEAQIEPEIAAQLYPADIDEDDVEDSEYGESTEKSEAPEAEAAK